MPRKNAERGVAFGEQRVDGRREKALHVEDGGERIRRVHRSHLVVAAPRDDVVARVHNRLPGELHVAAVERRAVVPANAVPEVIGDRQPVFRDAAVFKRRDDRRQVRNVPAARVQGDELVEDETGREAFDRVLRENRVELRGIDGQRHVQLTGLPWGALTRTARGERDRTGHRDRNEGARERARRRAS